MKTTNHSSLFLGIMLAAAVTGCAAPAPYVFGISNKNVSNGVSSVEIADQVTVCYNAEWAEPKNVHGLAAKECAKTKRKAKFVKHDFLACPVLLPARAYFSCVGTPYLQTKASVVDEKRRRWPGSASKSTKVEEIVPFAEPELPPELPAYLRK